MQKIIFTTCIFLLSIKTFAQCTAAKDTEMQKYLEKTQKIDAQGCSQCGMLALYFCSARHCVKQEDIQKVGQLINACKQNIINMGQPYCCPEYINKTPEWGKDVGTSSSGNVTDLTTNTSLNSSSTVPEEDGTTAVLNVLNTLDLGGSEVNDLVQNYAEGQQLANAINGLSGNSSKTTANTSSNNNTTQVVNAVNALNLGSNELSTYAQNYAQGQQIAEVATGILDLFTPSAEEKARKEAERVAAERRATEYRNAEIKLRYENENKAKNEFAALLKKYPPTSPENKHKLVIDVMDNYVSEKYNFDAKAMIPDWSLWIKEAIDDNNKFASVVFAGKALGFNFKKFQYNIGLTKENAVQILEKVGNSNVELKSSVGLSYVSNKKTIATKSKKKKGIAKEVNTFKISTVKKGSSAENAGLMVEDIILKINNSYVDDFAEAVQKFKIGEKQSVTILRNGTEITKDLIIESTVKDNYKVDAILILANNYNLKNGGNDPEKALYYFTKAAENGSPNAMFALGEIYQNNIFGEKKTNVKYKFKKNVEFALEWYLKSIQDVDYKPSNIHFLYKTGSAFEPRSFDELILMYKKGIGCKKNVEKADEILGLKNAYFKNHPEK